MSKLVCPFCQQELSEFAGTVDCVNIDCIKTRGWYGNKKLWQELIDTKKKLDRAIMVIQEVSKMSDKLSRKYGDTLVEQLDTIQAFCWEQGYILTHDEDFKRAEQINQKEEQ